MANHFSDPPFEEENLIVNGELRDFARQVAYICRSETREKSSTDEANQNIQAMLQQLENSKQKLAQIRQQLNKINRQTF